MTTRPRVLLLSPTRSYRVEPFLAAARALDVDVTVGSDRCHTLAEEWGVPLALDFRKPEIAAAQAVAYGKFDAVIPTDDATTLVASLVARDFGLRCNPPEASIAARNKASMRARLHAAGVAAPRFEVIEHDQDASAAIAAADRVGGVPVVLKPLLFSGSRGVIRADDADSITSALARIRAILATPDHRPATDPDARRVLVEAFAPGHEVAVEGILRDGRLETIAIFDKPDPLDGPFFEETIYITPAGLDAEVEARVTGVVAAAARALGLSCGPVHAELRLDGDRCVVIEVAGRSIGGLCSRTIELTTGRSLEELVLRDALGLEVPETRATGAAGVMMLPIPRRGLLREVRGIERALAVEGIESVEITAPIDNEIVPLPEGASYLGFLFARAATPARVDAALRRAHGELELVIVPNLALPRAAGRAPRSSD